MNANTPIVRDYIEQIRQAERECKGDSAAFSKWSKNASMTLRAPARTSGGTAKYKYQAFRFAMRLHLGMERELLRAEQDRRAVLFHG